MIERVIIRRMSGGRPAGVEEFNAADNRELIAGREPDCAIQFDADKDDLVSRRHARISLDRLDTPEVTISDLGSSNGTFVNRQRVFTSMRLNPGDLIQLGPGGPEFQFDYEPKQAKATRMADVPPQPLSSPTRQASLPALTGAAPRASMVPPPMNSGSTNVGKATVERMITHGKTETRNQMLWGGFALLLVVLGAGGYLLTRPAKTTPGKTIVVNNGPETLDGAQIAAKNTDAVVYIEVAWSLIDGTNSRTLSQVYLPNSQKGADGKDAPIVPGAGPTLPVFISVSGSPEPLLSTDDGAGAYVPIGERASGSGFVVSSSGFILTNRHVATGWESSYSGWTDHGDQAGLLFTPDGDKVKESLIGARSFPTRWVPSQAKVIIEGRLGQGNFSSVRDAIGFAHQVQGRNDVLDVTFAKSRLRNLAKVTKVSDHVDVALIKVDTPEPLTKVEINDNYETVQPGANVTVMGYPGVSPQIVQAVSSADPLGNHGAQANVPYPTISNGNIGQVLRNGANNTAELQTISTFGDYYQLAINTTGHGNSGGPVFDDHGKVIGIFTAGLATAGAAVSFAVPIKFGLELMK
jgi:serine protease Do